jgi:hypothetical protein
LTELELLTGNKMKEYLTYAALAVLAIAVIFGVIYTTRLFSNATTPITLHTPKPGVTCAAMVTGSGPAISCWKD